MDQNCIGNKNTTQQISKENYKDGWQPYKENKNYVKIEGNVKFDSNNFNIEYPNFLSLIITLIYAIFPWSIKYTVSYWNPHFIIILLTLMIGYFFDVVFENKSKKIALLIITIALMPFFHMIIIYAILVLLIIFLINLKKVQINLPYFILGIAISLIIWLPFLIFDKNNNFFILNSYFNHESVFKFKT